MTRTRTRPVRATTAAAPPAVPAAGREPTASPRHAIAWAALVYAVFTLLLGYPALAGRFLVSPVSDQYIGGYALRDFAAASLRAGHGMPLWNPYLFGGMPYVASMNGDMFYPTALLRVLLPTDVGMTWGLIIHVFLAGLFTYLYLRAEGLGFRGALLGGLAYMMAGNVAGLVSPGHDGKLFVAALLPLGLLLVHRGVRDGRPWAWGGLALTVLLAVLSPHPQALQYFLLVAGAYALYTALAPDESGRRLPRGVVLRRLGLATLAVALGMLGGAIQFLPLMEYTPWSPRAGGKPWEHAISYSMPLEEMIDFYLPQFSGILDRYWGRNAIHLHSEYLGAAVLVLAGLAYRAAGVRRRLVWFWSGVFVVALLWSLGGYTPFFHLVYVLVPGTKYFRAPSVMLFVVSFSVAVLAGVGVDRALEAPPRPRYAVAWICAALVVALLATTGALTNLAHALVIYPSLEPRIDANATALLLGAWRSALAVAAVAIVLLALGHRRLAPRRAAWLLVAIVGLDLWSVERLYWNFSPRAAQLYAGDAVIDYLMHIPQPARVVPLATQALAGSGRDPYLGYGDGRADGLMVHGIRSVVGYHGNEMGRYEELTGWDNDWPQRLGSANLWRLLNAKYLYTNAARPPMQGMRLVAGPARDAAGNTIYLYQYPADNPAAWVAPIAVKAPDDRVLPTLLDPRFDVTRAALFDTAAAVPVQPVPGTLPPPTGVSVHATRWEPGHIALTLDPPAPAGAALVVSENYYPGWSARVDGRPAAIGRVDYVLTGVALPTGARRVELSFASPRYEQGKAITIGCVLLALGGLLAGVLVERRAPAGHRDSPG